MRHLTRSALALALAVPTLASASEWKTDASHSAAHFQVDHLMVSTVRGSFSGVEGTLDLNEKDISKSKVTAEIDVATIGTGSEQRDGHLRSADFLDAEKHPKMTFTSTRVQRAGKDRLKVTGDLTLRGVTRPLVLLVEVRPPVANPFTGQPTRGFTATGKLDRKDYGLVWNKGLESGGVLVGDEVTIVLDAEFVPAEQEQAAK